MRAGNNFLRCTSALGGRNPAASGGREGGEAMKNNSPLMEQCEGATCRACEPSFLRRAWAAARRGRPCGKERSGAAHRGHARDDFAQSAARGNGSKKVFIKSLQDVAHRSFELYPENSGFFLQKLAQSAQQTSGVPVYPGSLLLKNPAEFSRVFNLNIFLNFSLIHYAANLQLIYFNTRSRDNFRSREELPAQIVKRPGSTVQPLPESS